MNPDEIAKLITEDPDIMIAKCPVCGSGGEAGFTGFACSNPGCQNYDPRMLDPEATRDAAIRRFEEILPTLNRRRDRPGGMGYLYSGRRTKPESVVNKFLAEVRPESLFRGKWEEQGLKTGHPTPESIAAGEWDREIEESWHDRAGAEYWYKYEKDYG
jgi:hypothetical protein